MGGAGSGTGGLGPALIPGCWVRRGGERRTGSTRQGAAPFRHLQVAAGRLPERSTGRGDERRAESAAKGLAACVAVTIAAWELWILVTVWRGGHLPVPFTDWTTTGHPFVALLLFVFGTPFVAAIGFALTMTVASPLLLFSELQRDTPDKSRAAVADEPVSRPVKRCPGSSRFAAAGLARVECNSCGHSVRTTETESGRFRTMEHTTAGAESGTRMTECSASGMIAATSAAHRRCPECGQLVDTTLPHSSTNRSLVRHLRPSRPERIALTR